MLVDPDLLVGCVAVGLGLFALWGAIFNPPWYYQLRKARWVEARWGRTAARICYAGLGLC